MTLQKLLTIVNKLNKDTVGIRDKHGHQLLTFESQIKKQAIDRTIRADDEIFNLLQISFPSVTQTQLWETREKIKEALK